MPEHVFTVAAAGHSVDVQRNTLTLFSILEQIGTPTLPMRFPELTVATLWVQGPEDGGVEFTQRIRFIGPDGGEIAHFDTPFAFDRPRQRVLTVLGNVLFKESGSYRLEVHIRKSDVQAWGPRVASYPLDVVATDQQSDQPLLADVDSNQTG